MYCSLECEHRTRYAHISDVSTGGRWRTTGSSALATVQNTSRQAVGWTFPHVATLMYSSSRSWMNLAKSWRSLNLPWMSKKALHWQLPPGAASPRVDTGRRILDLPNRRPDGGLSGQRVIDENGCSPNCNLRTPPQVHSLVDLSRVNHKLEFAEGKKMTTLDPPIGLSVVEQECSGTLG